MTDLLAIPLKRASDVEILKPLKNLITSRYESGEAESYIEAINEFSKLRSNSTSRALDCHEGSLDTLYRFYDQICALESKIPAAELQIPFKWKDAFDRGSIFGGRISLTVSSLAYEKVCVLFNIAAMQSQVASSKALDSDENRKQAAKFLQSSSGILTHLKSVVMSAVQQDPTPDMQVETLTALAALMLAQAQEVFVNKAIADRMKDGIVAKLAAQCDDLYADAQRHMGREQLKPLWDRDWLPKVGAKQAIMAGLAQYHQSRVLNAEKMVGEEIARLQVAMEHFKIAQSRCSEISSLSENSGRAQRALEEAKKDNDFIYHERIPDVKNLAPISKGALAKSTPMPERFSAAGSKDLFEALVPVVVQQALTQYDTRKQEIVNGEITKLRESTQLLNSILASLNLPAAIEDTTGESLPPSLREKSKTVHSAGGIQYLDKMINDLPDLLTRNKELLDECERQLKEEKTSDDQLRTQFKERWSRTPSDKLTSTFTQNSTKYRKVIETAMNADQTIKEKYSTHKEGMQMLSQGPEQLATALPSATTTSGGGANQPAVMKLRQLMESVEAIKAERDVIESELKGSAFNMRDVFLSALAKDGAINEPAISTESLGRTLGPLQKQTSESLSRQESLVADIQSAHTEFTQAQAGSGGQRESLLKKLAAAYDAFNELRGNLEEGTKFYNDLTQLLVTFQTKVNDYCFARRTEKEEHLKDLTSGYANQPVPDGPAAPAHHQNQAPKAAPPPRPPPPAASGLTTDGVGSAPAAAAPAAAPANPYAGAPQPNPYAGAPAPYPGAPPTANLPYPVNPPQGMPVPNPQAYAYTQYQYSTPMPAGYNPYFQPQQPQQPPPGGYAPPPAGYPAGQAPYPTQQYPGYPQYPPQQQWPNQ